MAKINVNDYRKDRTHILMDTIVEYATLAKSLTCAGYKFEQVHEAQLVAADIVGSLDDEGLLDLAEELYPWEVTHLQDYMEIYNEISNGVPQ